MSPRHAPQPLPLAAAESHRPQYPAQDPNGPLTTGGPVLSTPSPRLASPPLSDSGRALGSAPDSRSRSPSSMTGIGIATSGETTTLQVVPSPTSSRSPRSPRSPVSKFNTSAKAQAVDGPGLSPSPSQTQAPSTRATPSPSPSLPPPSHAGSVPESHIQSQQVSLHLPRSKYQARSARTVVTSGSVTPDPGDDDDDFEDDYHQYQQQQARTEYSTRDEPPATTPTLIREGAGQFHFGIPQPQQQQPQQQQPQQQQPPPPLQQQHQQPAPPPPPPPPAPAPAPSQQQPPHREEEKHSRSASRFFNFNKGPRLGNQNTGRYHSPSRSQNHLPIESSSEAMSRGTDYPSMSDRVSSKTSKYSDHSSAEPLSQKGAPPLPSRSDASIASGNAENDGPGSSKRSKPKPFNLLHRTRSMKDQESPSAQDMSAQVRIQEPEKAHTMSGQQPLNTAPVLPEDLDRSYRQMMNATPRNHSAERVAPRAAPMNKDTRSDKDHAHNRSQPSSLHNTPGGSFFNGLRSSGTRAADMISKGLFGKSSRSGSTTEKEPVIDDEHYQLKVINLPLIEQTRITRISKRLEDSRDKTEFWMPAFPWRAIDYLNYKGCDVEGLYRVPGSGPQIKKWQRKFDEDFDVDLFAQDDLYDINIIGSMLKAWLRELPDELFPKEAQERIARECAGAEEVPQLLIDELSNLSPYNYYLLFAITCHLSLLLAHSDRNKMDFRNLCICFQPCMKIDAFCFRFLVCDWRQCWQGCKTEARYIEEEYMLFDQPPPKGLGAGGGSHPNGNGGGGGNGGASSSARGNKGGTDDRNVSSSDSGKPSMQGHTANHYQGQQQQQQPNGNGKLRKKSAPSNGSVDSTQSTVSSASLGGHNLETPRRSNELRPLSPIKPLSPLGF